MIKTFVFNLLLTVTVISAHIDYEDTNSWSKEYPQCGGSNQSPINIGITGISFDLRMQGKPIKFTGYDMNSTFTVTNNGHTVQFTPTNNKIKISGGNLNGEYVLTQFHFHWGVTDTEGSEHALFGIKYPLEVHFVHKKDKEIAVVGFFFALDKSDNMALKPFLDLVDKAIDEKYTGVVNLVLTSFLLTNPEKYVYYRYNGSLTTPNCDEGVIWTIFHISIPISKSQMASFHKNKIKKNWRNLQKLNNRNIFIKLW